MSGGTDGRKIFAVVPKGQPLNLLTYQHDTFLLNGRNCVRDQFNVNVFTNL